MTDKQPFSPTEPSHNERITSLLRTLVAPPADPRYWESLTERIMARVREEDAWWQPFSGWVNVGLLAAGVAAVLLGITLFRDQQATSRAAYVTVIETPRAVQAQLAIQRGLPPREATLRYVVEP
ncbi:MAG: hypothetical protein ABR543_00155 [Gemmatimonadaceae bacterium]